MIRERLCSLLAVLVLVSAPAFAALPSLSTGVSAASLSAASTPIGAVNVDGLGMVKFDARREGSRVFITARSSAGQVVGKGESTVDMSTPKVFVETPQLLMPVTIHWKK